MSGDSKKTVICGICGKQGRRDNMKSKHFPNKHKGEKYCEKGDQSTNKFFQASIQTVTNEDEPMEEDKDDEAHDKDEEEEQALIPQEDINDHVKIVMPTDLKKEIMDMFEPILQKNLEEIVVKKLNEMQLQQKERESIEDKTKVADKSCKSVESVDLVTLQVKNCRSISDLCTAAGLTMYRSEKQLVCDICDEASESSVRKAGEFSYNFEAEGVDFKEKNLPQRFRNLKKIVVDHLETKNHKNAENKLHEDDENDKKEEIYNYKVGSKLAKMIYSNVKERNLYTKYERDVAMAASNGEEIGNINHGKDFAKEFVEAMGVEVQVELTKFFNKTLPCTDEKPPVSFASDKMTMKRKTGHITGVITPDVEAPLSETLLKPVFLAMPVTRHHDGVGLATQMLTTMDLFLSDVEEQVQSICNDGQYVHLNIKKHMMDLHKGFKDKSEWILFSHDPAHRINLGSNDATKDNPDGTKKEGSLKDIFDLVQKINKHVLYGKHNLELEAILKDIGITDKNKPLTFSDTRFPQYAYFVLRNFINSYQALIRQMEYELTYTKDKAEDIRETLKEATDVEFVVKVVGATDIFRRQQIMSQQSQKVDQLISDVFGNLKLQVDKEKDMNEGLNLDKHPNDWDESDVMKLDQHLWAETRKALLEIVTSNTYKEVKLKRKDKLALAVAIVELRNHLSRNTHALEERFKDDFNSDFVENVKDSFDFNYMNDLKEAVDDNEKTELEAYDEIEVHGNDALKFLMLRQSKIMQPKSEDMTKLVDQYKEVKKYAFDILMSKDMTRNMRFINEHAIQETAVCLTCHRRFNIDKIKKHNVDIHGGEITQFCDRIVKYSSIKIMHGICKDQRVFENKKKFLAFALKIFCKTPNESVIESMGSIAELHTTPQRNCDFKKFEAELLIDWNGPNLTRAQGFLEKSLDRHFGTRKQWRFKSGSSKFFVSKVVDRINNQPSRLSFME